MKAAVVHRFGEPLAIEDRKALGQATAKGSRRRIWVGPEMSTMSCPQCVKAERDSDHQDCECACHAGERERIAFHYHQFEHECYGQNCPESGRLYAAWQSALRAGP